MTCVALGRKDVVASGGEDKKVNVWKVTDKPTVACSLSASSGVSCVALNDEETDVVSGARGGAVRMWDIEAGSTKRVFAGHRNCVNVVHCHPFSDFVASGGADATVKIWDARRKACIQTYKGQGGEVDVVRFSPDGKWVASCARKSGTIKIWDLTAGKALASVTVARERPHVSATHLEFSPKEFVLAAAGTDKVLRLYDLEAFQGIAATPPDSAPVKALAFSQVGRSVVAATDIGLRQWSKWDTPRPRLVLFENGDVDFRALTVRPSQTVLAASFAANFLCLWSCPVEPDPSSDDDLSDDDGDSKNIDDVARGIDIVRISSSSAQPEPKRPQQQRPPSAADSTPPTRQQPVRRRSPPKTTTTTTTVAEAKAAPEDDDDDDDDDDDRDAKPMDDTASVLTEMLIGRSTSRALEARLEALQTVTKLWAAGDVRETFECLRRSCTTAPLADLDVVPKWCLVADFLSAVDVSETPSLDHVNDLLALLGDLIKDYATTKDEKSTIATATAPKHLLIALGTVLRAADLFADYVAATLDSAVVGVDLARDERRARCEKAKRSFVAIGAHLGPVRSAFPSSRLDDVATRLEAKLRASFVHRSR